MAILGFAFGQGHEMLISPQRHYDTALQDTGGRAPAADGFAHDMLAALAARQRRLSPKYFYDEAGSALFDLICDLPEY
jgi:uncharacterized SAM-dependent methyltransferase